MLVCRWTSIGLPPRERRKRPAAPIESASPAPSREIPPAKAFAISTGMSAKTSTAEIADRRRFILATALAVDALQQLVLLDQPLDLRQRRGHWVVRGDRRTRH